MKIVTDTGRRRQWRHKEKARLVEETLAPGATVAEVARRHGVAQSSLYAWRQQAVSGRLGGGSAAPVLMPVAVTAPEPTVAPSETFASPAAAAGPHRLGMIEIDLSNGRRLRVDRDVDAAALRRVLGVLEQR